MPDKGALAVLRIERVGARTGQAADRRLSAGMANETPRAIEAAGQCRSGPAPCPRPITPLR